METASDASSRTLEPASPPALRSPVGKIDDLTATKQDDLRGELLALPLHTRNDGCKTSDWSASMEHTPILITTSIPRNCKVSDLENSRANAEFNGPFLIPGGSLRGHQVGLPETSVSKMEKSIVIFQNVGGEDETLDTARREVTEESVWFEEPYKQE